MLENNMKKRGLVFAFLFIFGILAIASFAYAIDLSVEKTPVNQVYIKELKKPAVFDFKITNNGDNDNFEFYSLAGVDISPKGTFPIARGEVKNIKVEIYPQEELLAKTLGYLSFSFKIRGQSSGSMEDKLDIRIIGLKDAFEVRCSNIAVGESEASCYVQNNENIEFEKVNLEMSSALFSDKREISLKANERKIFGVVLDKSEVGKLIAGSYVLTTKIRVEGKEAVQESNIKFTEKSDLQTTEETAGFIIYTTNIEKKNVGNLPTVSDIKVKKNIISRLFTTVSPSPDAVERAGWNIYYRWQRELKPSESQTVKVRTNWLLPIIIILAILIIIWIVRKFSSKDVDLRKRVVFVKTKTGVFALKVIVSVSARKFVEDITVKDKLPALVKLYERYGSITPDRYDEKYRRLEWDIDRLNEGEERVFSYIIYSKVGVMGRFALPIATASYEKDGKLHETESNSVFFVTEQRERAEEE